MEDAGALPIEFDVTNMNMGDVIDLYPYDGKVCDTTRRSPRHLRSEDPTSCSTKSVLAAVFR